MSASALRDHEHGALAVLRLQGGEDGHEGHNAGPTCPTQICKAGQRKCFGVSDAGWTPERVWNKCTVALHQSAPIIFDKPF